MTCWTWLLRRSTITIEPVPSVMVAAMWVPSGLIDEAMILPWLITSWLPIGLIVWSLAMTSPLLVC